MIQKENNGSPGEWRRFGGGDGDRFICLRGIATGDFCPLCPLLYRRRRADVGDGDRLEFELDPDLDEL